MIDLKILTISQNATNITKHSLDEKFDCLKSSVIALLPRELIVNDSEIQVNRRGRIISDNVRSCDISLASNETLLVHVSQKPQVENLDLTKDPMQARKHIVFSNPVALYNSLRCLKNKKYFEEIMTHFPELRKEKIAITSLLNDQTIHSILNSKDRFEAVSKKCPVLISVLLRMEELFPHEYSRHLSGPEEIMEIFNRDYTVDPVLSANPGHLMSDATQEELRNVNLSTMTMDPSSVEASLSQSHRFTRNSSQNQQNPVISSTFLRSVLNAAAANNPSSGESTTRINNMDTSMDTSENNPEISGNTQDLRVKYKTQIEQLVSMGLPLNDAMLNVLEATNGSIELAMNILFN